jgi:tetratricopeptide (TPR) repeat protein
MLKNIVLIIALSFAFFACQNTTKTEGDHSTDTTSVKQENEEKGFTTADPVDPQTTGGGKKRDIRTLFDRGVENVKANRYEEGLDYFNRVIELDPDNALAYYNRGYCYYSMKQYEQAVPAFDKAIELNPRDSISYLYKGLIKYYQQDFPGSIELYNKALEIYPRYPMALYNRGISKGQLKDYAGAIEDFTEAIKYNPDFADAMYNRGLAWYFSNRPDKACDDWQRAKELGSFQASEAVRIYCSEGS